MGSYKLKIQEGKSQAVANRFAVSPSTGQSVASLKTSTGNSNPTIQSRTQTEARQKSGGKIHQLKSAHEKGCNCPSCCGPSLLPTATTQLKAATVEVRVNPAPIKPGSVAQRTGASVFVNGREKGNFDGQAKGGVGGVSHAEQKAWSAAREPMEGNIEFDVDRPICAGCVTWFESIAPTIIKNGGKLTVSVTYQGAKATVNVTGPGTNWGTASEDGYYGVKPKAPAKVVADVPKIEGKRGGGKKGGKKGR